MKTYTKTENVVVAEFEEKFWGVVYQDGHGTTYDYTSLDRASYRSPEFCLQPTDMTWTPDPNSFMKNSDFDKLKKAKLKKCKIEISYSIED